MRSLLLIVCFVMISPLVWAEEVEYKNMEQMLEAIHLEKKQVESILDKMIASGRITKDEGKDAKRALAAMNEDDLEKLKGKALVELKSKKNTDH